MNGHHDLSTIMLHLLSPAHLTVLGTFFLVEQTNYSWTGGMKTSLCTNPSRCTHLYVCVLYIWDVHTHLMLVYVLSCFVSDSLRLYGLQPTRLLYPWSIGVSRQDVEWDAMPFSRGSPQPRDWTCVFCDSCISGGFFTAEPLGEPMFLVPFWMCGSITWVKKQLHHCSLQITNHSLHPCYTPDFAVDARKMVNRVVPV